MRNTLPLVFAGLIVAMLVGGPYSYKRWRDREYRNFHVVEDGILYRSGQLPLPRLQQVVSIYGIRTIISLRDGSKPVDELEEGWAKAKGLNFVRIPYRNFWPDAEGKIPVDISAQNFRDIMDKTENYPVLVHCFAGIHRTGTMCAIFRMDYQNWTNEEAMAEMRTMGYSLLDDHEDVHAYLKNYYPPQGLKRLQVLPVGRHGP